MPVANAVVKNNKIMILLPKRTFPTPRQPAAKSTDVAINTKNPTDRRAALNFVSMETKPNYRHRISAALHLIGIKALFLALWG